MTFVLLAVYLIFFSTFVWDDSLFSRHKRCFWYFISHFNDGLSKRNASCESPYNRFCLPNLFC